MNKFKKFILVFLISIITISTTASAATIKKVQHKTSSICRMYSDPGNDGPINPRS